MKLTQDECLRLLATAPVGRFVFTVGALPAVVPVAFAVDADAVIARTTASLVLPAWICAIFMAAA